MTDRDQVRVIRRAVEAGHFGAAHRGWVDKGKSCEGMTKDLVARADALLGEPAKAKACEELLNLVVYRQPMGTEALGRTILWRMGRIPTCGVDGEGRSYAYLRAVEASRRTRR